VIKTFDDGDKKERKFGHALIAGIDRYPRKIKRSMSDKDKVRERAAALEPEASLAGISAWAVSCSGQAVARQAFRQVH
jgi:hypothetical protein